MSEKTKHFSDIISENIILKPTDNDKRAIGSMNVFVDFIRLDFHTYIDKASVQKAAVV